ncbi:MAG: HigA family addiction module antitoxin [Acidimicrobiia bacterium]
MATDARIWPDIAIPPGELLAETLETLGLRQAELARRTGRPAQAINEIIRGTKEITPETALPLDRVLGVPAHIWVRLEADYRFNRARLEDRARLQGELPLASRYPYPAMAALGWVPSTRSALERVQELLRFFGVVSLQHVRTVEAAAFRKSRKVNSSPEALAAWLRQGTRSAQGHSVAKFSAPRLRAALSALRTLTQEPPEHFEGQLVHVLAEVGVALVLVPHLPGTGAHGATRWLSSDKALIQMSVRYGWDDIFWFSLFHELGHLLLHGRDLVFIEGLDDGGAEEPEREADHFASDHLIPTPAYQAFLARSDWATKTAVRVFAQEVGVAPSIVVGRLHHDGHLPHSHFNDLRSRFVWAENARP